MARPAAAPDAFRRLRRERDDSVMRVAMDLLLSRLGLLSGRGLDGLADARVGTAAADVAAHCLVDVLVGRVRVAVQQRLRREDLARLAVTALRRASLDPRLLQRVRVLLVTEDRKSTRLNSSHVKISYAVFCL